MSFEGQDKAYVAWECGAVDASGVCIASHACHPTVLVY
jgi:hypothetical protein